ncbi:MAG: ABC transporter substrate-binding protein [Burkholderiales bacterium]|nr:ABC transporter substrate-binding protein [Burkholderiales bacterium]
MAGLAATGPLVAQPARNVEISFYFPVAVGGPVTALLGRLIEDFEREHPEIRVRPIYAGTYQEALAKSLTGHKSGAPPDLAVLFAADMFTLIDADAIVPFDDVSAGARLDPKWMEGFFPALMANSRAGGKTWGIPFQRSTILLYWNKAHFRESGLDPEKPPATWQEMQGFATRLTRREGGNSGSNNSSGLTTRWGVQIPSSGFPYWLFQGLTTTNGATLMNASGTQTQFAQPAAVEALQYWIDLARVHKVHPPGVVAWGTTPRDFRDEKVSMIWTTSGNLGALKAELGFDFGAAMLPAKLRRGSPTGGGNLYLFAKRPQAQREAALELARWLVTPERTAQWGRESGYIAVREAAWDTPLLKKQAAEFPAATVARDQLRHAVAELSTHENQRVTRVLNGALVAALEGAKSPREALGEAQAHAERILLPYQR